jgi:hypothetical protein
MAMSEVALACPGCAAPMHRGSFEKKLGGSLSIDICPACRLIWFDRFESLQLAAGGLLELFRLIHGRQADPGNPIPVRLGCPRCRDPLVLTHDLQRSTRFVYYRCVQAHGKLTAFYQFLREKNFVRSLSPVEVSRLKVEVKQLRCSGCGAPINLDTDSACRFCKAPIAVLDAEALKSEFATLLAEERQHRSVNDGLASVEGMIAALEAEKSAREDQVLDGIRRIRSGGAPDLLSVGVGLVARGYRPDR